MSSVESVLRRSRSLNDPPYTGTLELQGFEVGLRVHGKIIGQSSATADVAATSPLIAAEEIPTTTTSADYIDVLDIESFIPKAPRTTELEEVFHPSVDGSLCIFEYEDVEYVVGPIARKVYTASLEGSVEVTLVSELTQAPAFDFSLERIRGVLREDGEQYRFESNPNGVLEKLFSKKRTVDYMSLEEPRNCYALDDLSANTVIFTEDSTPDQLVPCELTATDSQFVIIAEVDDSKVSWEFPIDEFGRLPETVTQAFDLDSLYLYVEQEKTAFVRVRPAEYGEDSILTDTSGEYLIKGFE